MLSGLGCILDSLQEKIRTSSALPYLLLCVLYTWSRETPTEQSMQYHHVLLPGWWSDSVCASSF